MFTNGTDPLLKGLTLKGQDNETSPSPLPSSSDCPNLRVLELGEIILRPESLEDLVRSRISPSGSQGSIPLRGLLFKNIHLRDGKGNLQWLQDLVQEGILKGSDREIWVGRS